jgi:hypothetical protein
LTEIRGRLPPYPPRADRQRALGSVRSAHERTHDRIDFHPIRFDELPPRGLPRRRQSPPPPCD